MMCSTEYCHGDMLATVQNNEFFQQLLVIHQNRGDTWKCLSVNKSIFSLITHRLDSGVQM